MNQIITGRSQFQGWGTVNGTSANTHVIAPQAIGQIVGQELSAQIPKSWIDEEFRQAYMEATVHQDIAWQIKINRENRNITQAQLAKAIGTKQSAISRVEDSEYEGRTIPTLVKIAHAFGCALRVKLIPYSTLSKEVKNTSEESFAVQSFEEEIIKIGA
jgi:transcriptional regulator with XRE-family HTH domain